MQPWCRLTPPNTHRNVGVRAPRFEARVSEAEKFDVQADEGEPACLLLYDHLYNIRETAVALVRIQPDSILKADVDAS